MAPLEGIESEHSTVTEPSSEDSPPKRSARALRRSRKRARARDAAIAAANGSALEDASPSPPTEAPLAVQVKEETGLEGKGTDAAVTDNVESVELESGALVLETDEDEDERYE